MTTPVETDFPYQIILTERVIMRGYWYEAHEFFTAVGWDLELNAYVTMGGGLIETKSAVRATPHLLEVAQKARSQRQLEREARRKAWEEKRRVEQVINSAPPNPYAGNPLFGLF
ncbi:hypothetical protein [Mesorhizobium sp.]|uniref:hypothetical protein n=1 Tax=Mesorhizobium sp. TaxID=1871066 RepID=UPI000FE3C6FE|nr:hypothetical protein [Mesorhizobium sp.]RWJ03399.1 MAG: hypothetical protein EOR24_31970 [Mesorhizobium sp.]